MIDIFNIQKGYRQRFECLKKLNDKIKKCTKCKLYRTRNNAVPGEGPFDAKIIICGQAPGRTEDEKGRPFVGIAGEFLDELLELINLKRESIFITSSIKCFPPNNRPPKRDELEACRPYLMKQIGVINPKIIIALGNTAVQTLIERKERISQIHGKPQDKDGILIFPSFHPSAALRFPKIKILIFRDFIKLKEKLKKSFFGKLSV